MVSQGTNLPTLPDNFLQELGSPDVKPEKLVGSGSSSDVFSAQWQNALVAAKVLKRRSYCQHEDAEKRTYREWYVLKRIGAHPHILQCLGAARTLYYEPCLLFELMTSTLQDRFKCLETDRSFAKYLREIASGLVFLHRHGLLHGALITKNIMWKDGTVKIGDFGLAQFVTVEKSLPYATSFVEGTEYMPPEAFSVDHSYGLPLDVFSFGVLTLACLTRREPSIRLSAARTELDMDGKATPIAEARRRATDLHALSRWHPLRPLVLECWNLSPSRRPTVVDVLAQIDRYLSLLTSQSTDGGKRGKR
ncbi:uncharacterized protein LOC135829705 [Sycon ciliatum]|uniref:uncharacterized protein LOC135829705 n=1 Tax=Sycon ciliatum TaxID=27933 RepID=UPI0020A91422|eukprot:scpid91473/ scgid10108/ Probable serine/threonine-protein kinase DDB_G0281745